MSYQHCVTFCETGTMHIDMGCAGPETRRCIWRALRSMLHNPDELLAIRDYLSIGESATIPGRRNETGRRIVIHGGWA